MAGIFKAAWDQVRHVGTFSVDGMISLNPEQAPRFLPATGVLATGPDPVDYYVRFVSQSGTVVTVGGDQLFALAGFSFGDAMPLAIGPGAIGSGKLAFGPLVLTLNESVLAPMLLSDLVAGTPFGEIDVLGYATSGGALISDASFGLVVGASLTSSTTGGLTFSATYGSVELRHNSPGAGGVLTPDPSADWDSVINHAGFGGVPDGPLTAPATLPTTGVARADGGLPEYFVEFVTSSGTLTVEGATTFEVTGSSYSVYQALTATGSADAKVTLGPLTLSFSGAAANQLLTLLGNGTVFTDIELKTEALIGGPTLQLVSELDLADAVATGLTIGAGSSLQLALSYGKINLSHYNASGSVDASAAWNALTNTPSVATVMPTGQSVAPDGLVSTGGGATTDSVNGINYYVRLYNSAGTAIAVGGDTLFEISGYTIAVNHPTLGASGAATFGPLTVTLDDPALNTKLASLTDAGTTLSEIDVLGYIAAGPQSGHLVSDDSFGYVAPTQLSLDAGGAVIFSADYAALALQSEWDDRGTWTADTPGTWDVLTNSAAFQTAPASSGAPKVEPQTLGTTGISSQGADAASYYVRFVTSAGSIVTVGGAQLFTALDAGFASSLPVLTSEGSYQFGKAQFSPLTLTLADGVLDPTLFGTLSTGTFLGEVDVLGYNTTTGALLSDDSFGLVQSRTITIGSGGTLQFTAAYESEELQQHSVNSGGTLVADPVASWNLATNTTGFTTNGTTNTSPLAAPATLPGSGVAAGTQALSYYVRFISGTGTTLSLDGNQLFALGTFSTAGQNSATFVGGMILTGSTALDPLTLSFTDPALTPTLFGDLTGGTAFGEIDVIGYTAAGALVSEASFGDVDGTGLTIDGGGGAHYSAAYEAAEFQQFSGGTVTTAAAWNTGTRSAEFSINGDTPANPAAAPATLPGTGVAAAGTVATGEYVRFIETGGTTLSVDGAQLFALSGFSTEAANHSPYSATTSTLDALTLQLGEQALDPSLFGLLAAGQSFAEIDVLGYQVSDGLLVSDDSFGLAGAGSLSVDGSGTASYVVDYGAEELQYGATGLQADSGPIAATGTLTIAPLQSETVTGLIDSLVTPGLAGDTETIISVTGHASLAGGVVTYTAPNATSDSFSYTVEDELGNEATGLVDVTIAPACFCTGTRIATPAGETPVEALRAGDLVTLAGGGAAPVLWVGRQTVARRFADPASMLPVRVRAGALGGGLPRRDLLLSPGHALLLDGLLIQAGALVNGGSIARAEDMPDIFTYWHVELAEHAVLRAEGAAAESYLPAAEPVLFDNAADRPARAEPPELPHPRVKACRQLPGALRRRLAAARAAA